jgi:hypothetical protein
MDVELIKTHSSMSVRAGFSRRNDERGASSCAYRANVTMHVMRCHHRAERLVAVCGIEAYVLVLVQGVERVHLLFRQLKVEHLGVCNDPLFRVRLGQWDEPVAEFSLEDVRQNGENLPSLQRPSD